MITNPLRDIYQGSLSFPLKMDVVAAVSGYISKMVSAGDSSTQSSSSKMKILLLDSETVGYSLDSHTGEMLTSAAVGPYRVDRHHPIRPAQP